MNEFVARNGLIALDSSSISGPFVVTGSILATSGISAGGNVGMGPVLTLNGSFIGATSLLINANGSDAQITQAGNNSLILTNPLGIYTFKKTAQTDFFVINQHNGLTYTIGNFGIGTTSPTTRLDVRGNTFLSGSVGIQVASPSEILHIRGNLRVQTTSVPDSAGTASIILNPEISTPATIQVLANFGPTNSATYTSGFKFITRNRDASLGNPYYDVDAMSILANGSVGIGIFPFSGATSPLSASLEVGIGNLIVNGFCSIGKISPGGYGAVGSNYYLDSSGNLRRKNADMVSIMDMPTAGFRWLSAGVAAANSIISTTQLMILNNAGNLGIGITSPTFRLDVNGSFRSSGSITATSGSDYFDISHDITQPAQTGSQVYEVNITPILRYTAPNQTQTALRVAATFSGSTALSSSQSNIIADFGSTSAGSQLVVNDTTSGSIYMVNDVSGLPIIEANSNWDVFIYDYPTKVFQKSGSNITISGSFNTSGSITIGSGSGDLYMYGHKMFSVGQFQNNSTLSGSANVSQSFVYDTTDFSEGVTLVSGSRLTVANAGYYNIQFSAQLHNTVNASCNLWIWFKKNGINITESATRVVLIKDQYTVAAWNFAYPANANDYFEIVWQSDSANSIILYEPASGNIPIIPSIITSVTQIR